jgi:hypothetical protein
LHALQPTYRPLVVADARGRVRCAGPTIGDTLEAVSISGTARHVAEVAPVPLLVVAHALSTLTNTVCPLWLGP